MKNSTDKKKRLSKSPAVSLHFKLRGKLEIRSKIKVKNKRDLSLVYTPGVALVSEAIYKNPSSVKDLTNRNNTVAVLSNGSAVLGLGNIGPLAALPVMEGKAILFKEFADIDAWPIVIKAQTAQEIIDFAVALSPSVGGINLEDISAPICFEVENALKKRLNIPVMHDDQHGTAIVVLAGLINVLKVRSDLSLKSKIVINGAGSAGYAVADLLCGFGFKNILVLDSFGIISLKRKGLLPHKRRLAKITNKKNLEGKLEDAVVEADILIGVSKGGLFKESLIKKMNQEPIIFALANPIPEIMPPEAKMAGAKIVATGRSDFPNQLNNVLAFPGVFRGALDNKVESITREMKIKAAINLASLVKKPNVNRIIPDLFDKRVVPVVAKSIC